MLAGIVRCLYLLWQGSLSAAQSDVFSTLSKEAGISTYFQASTPIDLDKIRALFRTIEADTDTYIVGSVPIEGYSESHYVHVLASTDGWIVAYYLKSDPASKIVDWLAFKELQKEIKTKLETALATLAASVGVAYPGPTFYDFRYPDATNIMIIGQALDRSNFHRGTTVQFYLLRAKLVNGASRS